LNCLFLRYLYEPAMSRVVGIGVKIMTRQEGAASLFCFMNVTKSE
jgi:hypothetical protein